MIEEKKEVVTVHLPPKTVNRLKVLKGLMPKRTHDDVINELINVYVKTVKLPVKV